MISSKKIFSVPLCLCGGLSSERYHATVTSESRRPAVTILVIGGIAGAALILALQAFREPLREWLIENPAQTASRATLLIAAAGSLLVIPLLAFAAYAFRKAAQLEARQARGLRTLAAMLAIGALLLTGILWRLTIVLTR
ncbi:MAG TPA: hypothetical protein VFZ31_10490 [Vicinamibacterales bacterium]